MRGRRGVIYLLVLLVALPFGLAAGALLLNGAALAADPGPLARLRLYLTENRMETGAAPVLPELRSRRVALEPDAAYRAARQATELLGWRLAAGDPGPQLHAVVITPLLRFRDDVRIWIEPVGESDSMVRVRSGSRIGRGDFGANRRHILDFYAALDRTARLNRH